MLQPEPAQIIEFCQSSLLASVYFTNGQREGTNVCLCSEYSNEVSTGLKQNGEETWDTTNTLRFRATPEDNGRTIRCAVEHRALRRVSFLEKRITLSVYCEYSVRRSCTSSGANFFIGFHFDLTLQILLPPYITFLCWSHAVLIKAEIFDCFVLSEDSRRLPSSRATPGSSGLASVLKWRNDCNMIHCLQIPLESLNYRETYQDLSVRETWSMSPVSLKAATLNPRLPGSKTTRRLWLLAAPSGQSFSVKSFYS